MVNRNRNETWHWWVSGLLLLATTVNYMDRQTLSNLSVRVTQQFQLTNEQYGDIEFVFGIAFAIGSLFFGVIADRISVRFLYPAILVAWSAVGFATGLTEGYTSMLVCRGLLGFFESGHWPCALIVTQSIMASGDRAMGNSILQSGASLGAILTPMVIRLLVGDSVQADAWRLPFYVIGAVGLLWAILWLTVIRPGDLDKPLANSRDRKEGDGTSWLVGFLRDRRFWALAFMVVSINTSWQLIRAWLPKFLQEGRGYSEVEALYFNSTYFIATDVGCIVAGMVTLWLTRRGMNVHRSCVVVYFLCCSLAAMTTVAAFLPHGWQLLGTLLVVAAGTLGVFPCYYSFTQELTTQFMGRLTGLLSFTGWLASSPMQKLFGYFVDRTGSYDLNIAILGWFPMAGLIAFLILWPRSECSSSNVTPATL
jgi:MFS transporter, ACS family, hexuronate transporter